MFVHFEKLQDLVRQSVWAVDVETLSPVKAACIRTLRLVYTLVRELADGQLNLRAMSLVFTTLLALVPLLAVSFSVLKAFEVHNQLDGVLSSFLAPLGPSGAELSVQIIGFVDNMNVGVLGSLGLGLLFYTVISMLQKVERAFNYTWRVVESRGIGARISDYISVLVIGPVLMFSALGLTASVTGTSVFQQVTSIEPLGFVVYLLSLLLPYFLVTAAFVFTYAFVPNTKVDFRAALTGGVAAGLLWETTGWLFASVIVKSSQYTAIYSGFAILIFFMIWIYLSWLILLVGASLAFYTQNPDHLGVGRRGLRLSNRRREQFALQVMCLVARHYYQGLSGWTDVGFAKRFGLPAESLGFILTALQDAGLLVQTRDEPPHFVPACDFGTVTVKQVLDQVRNAEDGPQHLVRSSTCEPVVDEVMKKVDAAVDIAVGLTSIRELIDSKTPCFASIAQADGVEEPDHKQPGEMQNTSAVGG